MVMRSFSKGGMDLPMSSRSSVNGGGRSVQMETPIMRAIRTSTLYTRLSYCIMVFCFFSIGWGWRSLSVNGASTVLTCQKKTTGANMCTLAIKRFGERKKVTEKIHRTQIVRTNMVEINENNRILKFVTTDGEPDPEGQVEAIFDRVEYMSYTMVLRPFDKSETDDDDDDDDSNNNNLDALRDNLHRLGLTRNARGEYQLIMRPYEPNKRRNTSRNQYNRLRQYVSRTRHGVTLRERRGAGWKGIAALVLGMFGIMLTALLGQFWEEDTRPFVSRRRSSANASSTKNNPHSRSSGTTTRNATSNHNTADSDTFGRMAVIGGRHSTVTKRK